VNVAPASVRRRVKPAAVKAMLADGGELALVDVREELIFSQNHPLYARSIPLSRFELKFAGLVPRRGTRVVLLDDADGLAERAAAILERNGYTDVSVLDGGIAGWAAAGHELFSGVNVPSKAFGEAVEHESGTPSIDAGELERLIGSGTDMVVLDSRPFDEYSRVSIPTAINVPGAELVYRVHDIAPSPDTLVVVNCAGRTRSIIGAQSLINAGVPNKVVALRNGTMGWSLAGFTCDHGKNRRAPHVSSSGLAWAKAAAEGVAQRCGVARIDRAQLDAWRADSERTVYLLDVRDPDEYAAGHVAGAISAPGGQLVQATDQYVGTLGARLVLVDDAEVRAVMTASWLRQMGWKDVAVLVEKGDETGWPAPPTLQSDVRPDLGIEAAELAALMAKDDASVIDLSPSREYLKRHIPGAWFAVRSRLDRALKKIPQRSVLVLTSEDGVAASLAAVEACDLVKTPVRVLRDGNAAWQSAGHPLTADAPQMADDAVDQWLKPYERSGDTKAAMKEYLDWEVDLLPRVARDGTSRFSPLRR
jgi:rhodanese-related sulfurtransferase